MKSRLVYIGLGSNLDEPLRQVETALEELGRIAETRLLKASSLYRSPPMGPQDQPQYINAVAALETNLAAEELLNQLQRIENSHLRNREQRWGPRTLDLDLLLFGDESIDLPQLKVPHPGIAERAFVLVPLAEIAPQTDIPGAGKVSQLLQKLDAESVAGVEVI